MTFRRFLDIILRSMLLNIWLVIFGFCISLPLNGDMFFLSGSDQQVNMILLFLFIINFFHWAMELMALFIKTTKDHEDL